MVILGINAYHADSAACLLRDGELIAAAEEERFRRIKHWAGLPTQAIRYCLEEGGVDPAELDVVALNRSPRANWRRRALFVLRHRPAFRLVRARLHNLLAARSILNDLSASLQAPPFAAKLCFVEHHEAHLASAYFPSAFDEAACVSVDGCGDFASTAWGFGRGCITIAGRIFFPHSLGIFYSAITQWLGFRSFGDEYKVMGLAAYGRPTCLKQLRRVLKFEPSGRFKLDLAFFRHHIENVCYESNDRAPEVGALYGPALETLLGPARQAGQQLEQGHKDIAASAQALYEEALFSLLNAVHRQHPCPNLALAGGCALNSSANGKIHSQTPFHNLYIPPAAGDAGGAIGAALVVWHRLMNPRAGAKFGSRANTNFGRAFSTPIVRVRLDQACLSPITDHAYAGPQFGDSTIASMLSRNHLLRSSWSKPVSVHAKDQFAKAFCLSSLRGQETNGQLARTFSLSSSGGEEALNFRPWADSMIKSPIPYLAVTHVDTPEQLTAMTARAISAGQIVGWFQGRMEWGPRALGNRSILCDPRRADMKEILNAKIKRREPFRPFAPSILRGKVVEWFEREADVPFMSCTFQVRPEKRALIPAVTHVDGSARLQTVDPARNPLFHQLISDFFSLTSVPLLLNTSFNEQEPIVCRPEEALDCFLRTNMDVLVLGNFFIRRARGTFSFYASEGERSPSLG